MSRLMHITAWTVLASVFLGGCVKKDKKKMGLDIPDQPMEEDPVIPKRFGRDALQVNVEVRDDGIVFTVDGVPEGSRLECELDGDPLIPCTSGGLYRHPKDGDHTISVMAIKENQVVGLGESKTFTIRSVVDDSGKTAEDPNHPLSLVLKKEGFEIDQAIPIDKQLTFTFELPNEPRCPVKISCSFDNPSNNTWTDCSEGSFTITPEMMAQGQQFLSARASCKDGVDVDSDSARVGAITTVSWYGVPHDYKPLMLYTVKDPNSRNLLSLIRDLDCTAGQSFFECKAMEEDDFTKCPDSNRIDNPPDGYQMRYSCDGVKGPAYIFGDHQ